MSPVASAMPMAAVHVGAAPPGMLQVNFAPSHAQRVCMAPIPPPKLQLPTPVQAAPAVGCIIGHMKGGGGGVLQVQVGMAPIPIPAAHVHVSPFA
jgi:hypothetical protein